MHACHAGPKTRPLWHHFNIEQDDSVLYGSVIAMLSERFGYIPAKQLQGLDMTFSKRRQNVNTCNRFHIFFLFFSKK